MFVLLSLLRLRIKHPKKQLCGRKLPLKSDRLAAAFRPVSVQSEETTEVLGLGLGRFGVGGTPASSWGIRFMSDYVRFKA